MKRISLLWLFLLYNIILWGNNDDYSKVNNNTLNLSCNSGVYMLGSTGDYLPFWQRTGRDGIIPNTSSGLLSVGASLFYRPNSDFNLVCGTNIVGVLEPRARYNNSKRCFIDKLYSSVAWRFLRFDIGVIPRNKDLGELSITGGNVMYSGNSRNLPGINLHSDWLYFGKTRRFGVKANIAHYNMNDNRYVEGTLIHNKSISARLSLNEEVEIIGGFEHWAQWGGISPRSGKQPSTMKDYCRVFFALNGDENASISDQENVLGNHLGREYLRIEWRTSPTSIQLQYDKPFDDGSGMRLQNLPDGVYSLKISKNNRIAIFTDLLFEFITTTWQSGPLHDRPATEEEMAKQDPNDFYYGKIVLKGCDNYLDHWEYRSGWTYNGKVIGLPLIIPNPPDANGKTINFASTRVRGYHLGVQGCLKAKYPYILKMTYTKNYGKYNQDNDSVFINKPWQLSMGIEIELNRLNTKLPISIGVGTYVDVGQLYQDSIGFTLNLSQYHNKKLI